jgi:hypothetical protein
MRENSISFTLLSLPGSINEVYTFGYSINSPRPERKLKAEWALWKSQNATRIPLLKVLPDSIIRVDRLYQYRWFYKNGNWRKCDTANMDKLLFDLISQKIGVDDSRFKCGMMDSADSEANVVTVTLTEIPSDEWRGRQQ